MAYEPTNWKDGDLVTSAKLNKIEQGIAAGGGIQIIHCNQDTNTLDKTWQEIYDAGFGVIISETSSGLSCEPIIGIINENNLFTIITITSGPEGFLSFLYKAQSSSDYPVWYDPSNNDNNQEAT